MKSPQFPNGLDRTEWLSFVDRYAAHFGESEYSRSHAARYAETVSWIPEARKEGARALEVGSTVLFQELLRHFFRYDEVHGTDFDTQNVEKSYFREIKRLSAERTWYQTHCINIEDEKWPFADSYFDLILLCEVIEHMEVDPMHVMVELNRVLTLGGQILLSTPNSASARVLMSALNGYRPHFYMQYNRSRQLYRHNFEHDIHSVSAMLRGAGFEIEKLETVDCFNDPVPEVMRELELIGKPLSHRGDNIFALARKIGPVVDRYPAEIYSAS